jgi:hypothetical protein
MDYHENKAIDAIRESIYKSIEVVSKAEDDLKARGNPYCSLDINDEISASVNSISKECYERVKSCIMRNC